MAYGDGTFITNKSGSVTLQKYYGIDETGKKYIKNLPQKIKLPQKKWLVNMNSLLFPQIVLKLKR